MMETMRKAAQSWVAKILLGMLALSFGVLFGKSDFSNTVFFAQNLATIGSRTIDGQQFTSRLQQTLQEQSRRSGIQITLDEARKLGLDRQVLDGMIESIAMEEQANALTLRVGHEQIAQDIANSKQFTDAQGKFDPAEFRNALTQNGKSEAGFFQEQQQILVRSALISASAIAAPPKVMLDVQNQYANETRDVRFLTFPVSEVDVPSPTDAELKKRYDDNPVAYTAPEYRSVALMSVEPADIAKKFNPTEDELKAGYEKYGADYITPEKRSLLQISFPSLDAAKEAKKRLDGGLDMMALATEMKLKDSDIVFTDKQRGEFLDEAIADAAFKTAEGKISDPIAGALSTAIVKVTKVSPKKVPQLAEIKDQITERVRLDSAHEEILSIYDMVEDARSAQTKFEEIASKAGIKFQLIPAISAAGFDPADKPVDFPAREDTLKAIANSDVGLDNDAISFGDGFVWYDVRSVTPSAVKPLDAVKQQVTNDWKADKLRTFAQDKAKATVDALNAGKTLDALATEVKANVQTQQGLKRGGNQNGFDAPALKAVFGASDNGYASSVDADGKTVRIMKVEKSTIPAIDPKAPAGKALNDALGNSVSQDMGASLSAAARTAVGATVNESMWQQINGGVSPETGLY